MGDIGVDALGQMSIAWTDDRNGNQDIYATRGTATEGWSSELRVNDDTGSAAQVEPHIAVDGPGNVQVCGSIIATTPVTCIRRNVRLEGYGAPTPG